MNREIKFRGWNDKHNKWLYGYYADSQGFSIIIDENYEESTLEDVLVNKKTIGQYTGLKDKNGKEIYEGDILITGSTSNLTVEVVYNEEDTSFILKLTSINEVGARTLGSWLSLGYECAIIGNVYDNPELMKGDSNEA